MSIQLECFYEEQGLVSTVTLMLCRCSVSTRWMAMVCTGGGALGVVVAWDIMRDHREKERVLLKLDNHNPTLSFLVNQLEHEKELATQYARMLARL